MTAVLHVPTKAADEKPSVLSDEAKKNPIVAMILAPQAQKYIAPFLGKDVDIERIAATVLVAMAQDKTGTLKKCTPQSLVLGVARIMQWGLELGTTAYLLPFKNTVERDGTKVTAYEATPVADYKGLAELMIASGAVRFVDPKVVYEGDEFSFRFGLDPYINHIPCAKKDRGRMTHAYIVLLLAGAHRAFDVMAIEDIDEIRQRYSKQWKNGPCPPWYAKKTIVRQVSKLLPKNPKLAQFFAVLAQDTAQEIGDDPMATLPAATDVRTARDEDDDSPMEYQLSHREPGDEEEQGFTPPY